MLWVDSNVSLPNNYYSLLAQLKSPKKRYANTFKKDITKGYVIAVEQHLPLSWSDRELNVLYHLVVNPIKTGEMRRVFNGASKILRISSNKSLLVGSVLLQIFECNFAISSTKKRRLPGYRGYVPPGRSHRPRSIISHDSVFRVVMIQLPLW